MFGKSLLLLALTTSILRLQAEDVSKYVDVRPGSLPILITVPHGGDLKPANILARRYGVTAKDSNTAELSVMISEELQKLYGGAPHLVICRLHRSKLDCNRELSEAAQGDPVATATWKRFHEAAEDVEQQITQSFGTGLTIDLHGHRHEEQRVELGYLISGSQLNTSDEALDQDPKYLRLTSVKELDQRSPQSFSALIRGPQSLGAMLEAHGFRSIPSPSKPSPGKAIYFSGSYDVAAHGSRDGGSISAIQVECPWNGVRDTSNNQRRFAKALATALGDYFRIHFQMRLASIPTRSSSR